MYRIGGLYPLDLERSGMIIRSKLEHNGTLLKVVRNDPTRLNNCIEATFIAIRSNGNRVDRVGSESVSTVSDRLPFRSRNLSGMVEL